MAACGFVFWGFNHMDWQTRTMSWKLQTGVEFLLCHYYIHATLYTMLSFVLPVRDTVHGYRPSTSLNTTKTEKDTDTDTDVDQSTLNQPSLLDQRPHESNCSCVRSCSWLKKSIGLMISASFDILFSSKPQCKEHNRWLDVFQHETNKDVRKIF